MFDRDLFPTLKNNPDLVYLDNASSTMTHQLVLDKMNEYYTQYRSNTGRGSSYLARRVNYEIDQAKQKIAALFSVPEDYIIFTSGATESINLIAEWNRDVPQVLISPWEHNSNIAPWLAQGRTINNKKLQVIQPRYDELYLQEIKKTITGNLTKGSLVSMNAVSSVNGQYVDPMITSAIAKDRGMISCVDATQAITKLDLRDKHRFPDFLFFSGHKMFGPTGIGAIITPYAKNLRQLRWGGGAVEEVTYNSFTISEENKHNPGTPNIAGILGLGVAADITLEEILNHTEQSKPTKFTTSYAKLLMPVVDELVGDHLPFRMFPNNRIESGIISLTPKAKGVTATDIVDLMDDNIAVRSGKLCAHPHVNYYAPLTGVIRISCAPYTTEKDIRKLITELNRVSQKLKTQEK